MAISAQSYCTSVKDLVEKINKNTSCSTRFILLIFSIRYFNSNLTDFDVIHIIINSIFYVNPASSYIFRPGAEEYRTAAANP